MVTQLSPGLKTATDVQRLPRRLLFVFGKGQGVLTGVTQRAPVEDAGASLESHS